MTKAWTQKFSIYVYTYECMYVYMYVYMYVWMYVCICMCIYVCVYMYVYICMDVCIYRGNQLLWGYDESMDPEIQYICIYV